MKIKNTLDADLKRAIGNLRKISRTIVPESEISALNKAQRRLVTLGARATASEAKVPQKAIRSRLKAFRAGKKKPYTSLYIQRRDVAASGMRPKQNRRGVRAGKHQFDGAFIADGSKGVGKYRNKKFNPTRLKNQQVLQRMGNRRYPLQSMKVPIAKAATDNFQSSAKQVMKREYAGLLRHELKRRLDKLGINA